MQVAEDLGGSAKNDAVTCAHWHGPFEGYVDRWVSLCVLPSTRPSFDVKSTGAVSDVRLQQLVAAHGSSLVVLC